MVKHERPLMRTHLLGGKVSSTRYVEDCQLRILAIPYCGAPDRSASSLLDWRIVNRNEAEEDISDIKERGKLRLTLCSGHWAVDPPRSPWGPKTTDPEA